MREGGGERNLGPFGGEKTKKYTFLYKRKDGGGKYKSHLEKGVKGEGQG